MKKITVLILSILCTPILAAIYGAIHNQISYSISPDFYTKSMFPIFGFVEYGLDTPRLTAAIIGVWSTWWLGLIIGVIYGIVGLFKSNSSLMKTYIKNSIVITFTMIIGSGVLGLLFGKIYLTDIVIYWGFSGTKEQLKNFAMVGYMHDFEYCGAILAIIVCMINGFKLKKPNA
jgi:hypothetical protein